MALVTPGVNGFGYSIGFAMFVFMRGSLSTPT
jgi:formate/nitrite transporter FocA (FNT family)